MISRLNLSPAFVLAFAGLAILAIARFTVDRTTRPDPPTANRPARDGISDAMTFPAPAGPRP